MCLRCKIKSLLKEEEERKGKGKGKGKGKHNKHKVPPGPVAVSREQAVLRRMWFEGIWTVKWGDGTTVQEMAMELANSHPGAIMLAAQTLFRCGLKKLRAEKL